MPMHDEYMDLTTLGLSHGSDHTGNDALVGGRTAITTEANLAYNNLRQFVGLSPRTIDEVGAWAFANNLTNNTQAWGSDQEGVGLWYSMQGAKVGWIADDKFNPQIMADIQRTARLGSAEDVMKIVEDFGHEGFAEFLMSNGFDDAFINTLKMEPHYGGWMHDRAHGMLSIEGVAIAHDVNHLTVLSHDQMKPFMNDTWDWPQWPALDVTNKRVLEYFQSMVVLGDPLANHLSDISPTPTPTPTPVPESDLYEWTTAKVYEDGDRIVQNGAIYEAQWYTQGESPQQNSGNWEVWKLIGQGQSSQAPSSVAWDSSRVYTEGEKVNYQSETYEAQWWSKGSNPQQNSGLYKVWKQVN